jgi:type VI secretion system protein ImpH
MTTIPSGGPTMIGGTDVAIAPIAKRLGRKLPDGDSLAWQWNPPKGSLAHQLATRPQAFDFFQAVVLFERIDKEGKDTDHSKSLDRKPVESFHRIDDQVLRFSAPATHVFPNAQIDGVAVTDLGQTKLTVNFMGLTGPSGILPRPYTDLLARTSRDGRGDERGALGEFLDQFNHRLISLFFAAWTKYRFPIRAIREPMRETNVDVALAAVAGLPTPVRSNENKIDRNDLIGFAGLLSQHPRTAGNLESGLTRILGVPVRVHQFEPSTLELDCDSQTCLGVDNGCGMLGISTVVGPRTTTRQHKIRLEIGPVTFRDLPDFLPDLVQPDQPGQYRQSDQFDKVDLASLASQQGEHPQRESRYRRIDGVVRAFAGQAMEYDLKMLVLSDDVVGSRLGDDSENDHSGARLGFDSWLHSEDWPEILEDAIICGNS